MAERPIDVRSGAVVLRRRWRILTVFGILGLALGLTYGYLAPVQLTSRSIVLIAPGSGASGDSGGEIDTQVQLVLSRPVLEKAGRSVTPTLTADQVEQMISVAAQTAQLVRIEASSPHAAQAQALSQAVARSFVDTVADNVRSVTGSTVKELHNREDALAGQVKDLEQQIGVVQQRRSGESSKSGAGAADARLLADLTVQQSDLVLQLDRVKAELEATASSPGSSPTISIVQPAAPARGPGRLPALLSWSVVGAFVGLCLAGFVVVVRARRDPRLRARDDLADAVGSSVLVDVRSRPQHSVGEWSALLESYEASAVDAWAFRQLLRVLSNARSDTTSSRSGSRRRWGRIDHPTSLAVISFAGDKRGLAVAPQLAAFAASLGITTRVVIGTGDDSSASLLAAISMERDRPIRPGLILEARSKGSELADVDLPPPVAGSLDELLQGIVLARHPEEESAAGADGMRTDDERAVPDEGDEVATGDAGDDVVKDEAAGIEDDTGDRTSDSGGHDADGGDRPEGGTGDAPAPSAEGDLVPLAAWARGRADDMEVIPRHASTSLTIVLAVVNRKNLDLRELPPTDTTVLAISPGVGTREELARLAVAVDDTGRWLDGVVIADPDATDRTTGRHTLEERARQTPLPLRATGVPPSTAAFNDRG